MSKRDVTNMQLEAGGTILHSRKQRIYIGSELEFYDPKIVEFGTYIIVNQEHVEEFLEYLNEERPLEVEGESYYVTDVKPGEHSAHEYVVTLRKIRMSP